MFLRDLLPTDTFDQMLTGISPVNPCQKVTPVTNTTTFSPDDSC